MFFTQYLPINQRLFFESNKTESLIFSDWARMMMFSNPVQCFVMMMLTFLFLIIVVIYVIVYRQRFSYF